jgi:glycosyltransferase involved in cell wall biosynthesis
MTPLVTIIIPCYNDGLYVEEAIISALSQTYEHKEVIVVDDGSTIETKKVLEKLKNTYDFKLIVQENKGLSAARNTGFRHASGDYVLTLDADDYFDSSFLEKAVPILNEHAHVGFVGCFVNRFTNKHNSKKGHQPKGGGINDFAFRNQAVACSIYRKQCWEQVNGYDEDMKFGYEDWEFHVAITKRGWKCNIIPEYLFYYRDKPNSMLKATNINYQEANLHHVILKHSDFYKDKFPEAVDFLIQKAIFNKGQENKRLQSIEYRLGYTILKPFRWVKRKLFNK